jgi:hypothetical protein
MNEIMQLARWFVIDVVKAQGGIDQRLNQACRSIEKLISDGWLLIDIQAEIEKFAKSYPDVVTKIYLIDEIFVNKKPPNNLIEPDVFYYHNILREVPPPPKITIKDGKVIREEQPFYLEMKKRFTMEELLQYWYEKNGITPTAHMLKQDEGKFKYLLGIYNLDEILFAIDVSKTIRAERQLMPLRNVFDLERYMDDAREYILGKKNVHQLQGINQVIKRGNLYE